jgi:hypothetical protein
LLYYYLHGAKEIEPRPMVPCLLFGRTYGREVYSCPPPLYSYTFVVIYMACTNFQLAPKKKKKRSWKSLSSCALIFYFFSDTRVSKHSRMLSLCTGQPSVQS